jgi:putative PIN family toxin of toxin-antitoxin system
MSVRQRVVFDCNVYFQALISRNGPAARCFSAVQDGRLELFTSPRVVEELRDVCLRPHIARRFRLSDARVAAFVAEIELVAKLMNEVPHVFDFTRDPDDSHYVDLAIASQARLIVSRDRDLLVLNDPHDPDGSEFQRRYPEISIVTPVELLTFLRQSPSCQ